MRNKKIFGLFTVLSLAYIVVSLLTPTEQSVLIKYGLSEGEANILKLTISLPLVIIWYISYYGWSKINNYSKTVEDSPEGPGLLKLSNGLLLLVLWLPVTSTLSTLFRSIYLDHQNLKVPLTITANYINLAILLAAVILLSKGAYELKGLAKDIKNWRYTNFGLGILSVLSFFYVYVTLSNPYRSIESSSGTATYYLPDWLLSASIIFPYLVVFYLGFRAVQYIHSYKLSIRGLIYKNALKYIANGIGLTILSALAIRYLVSINTLIEGPNLKIILVTIYVLLLLIASGFVLIAKGAKKLQQIEEV